MYDFLNEEQKKAVLHTEGPLLILAGAGSGKTRVLTHRTAYLIEEKGVNPYHILAITFTNKAAQEMRERIDRQVGFGSESIWVSTFHSTCVRILRRHIDRLGYDNNFTIYDTDDQKNLMKEVCKRLEIDTKIHKEKMLLNVISSAKDELMNPIEFETRAAGNYAKLIQARVYREYQRMLKENNALDFDDLICKTVELFQLDKEVLSYYQERFRYIMVDEYQDTNTAQFELIRLLAMKYRNLCVVGDDDQSIYKFRGANIYNILNFEQHFEDARVIKLEQNYRSTETILKAANSVIANNTGRKDKTLWTENPVGDKVVFEQLENGYEEADYIARNIASRIRKGEYKYSDCAVLYRTNAQSRIFEERFINMNIPYKIVGGINFYSRKEIKDILSYLKTIDNGKDDMAIRRIINVPKRGIGETSIKKVSDYAYQNGLDFYDAMLQAESVPTLGKAATKILHFTLYIENWKKKKDVLSISALIEEILKDTGYLLGLEVENTEEAKERIQNIDELISKAVSYEESAEDPSLSGFLEEVALVADIDSVDFGSDYVVLMTLHSAKGLEFSNVYLAGMEDGLFPSYMSITSDNSNSELEEERRLAYVGITRAKEHLTITSCRMRMIRGEINYGKISRFVKEIPRNLLQGELYEPAEKNEFKETSSFQKARTNFRTTPTYTTAKSAKSFSTGTTQKLNLEYSVGDRVRHIKFGEGTVTSIVEGGRDYEVTVDFDTVGTKKMFASFAKLKKL